MLRARHAEATRRAVLAAAIRASRGPEPKYRSASSSIPGRRLRSRSAA
jgi:hypothetical protein